MELIITDKQKTKIKRIKLKSITEPRIRAELLKFGDDVFLDVLEFKIKGEVVINDGQIVGDISK